MNTLLTLAFNGAAYHGFQVQSNALGVCTVLQDAMERVLGARPDVKGCSRTDAGVHAEQYCVSFKYEVAVANEKLPLAINHYLPHDIRVMAARRVPEEFHARYSAAGKQYRYVMLNSHVDDPFAPQQYYRVPGKIDADAMHTAGQALVGRHDFAAFMSAGSDVPDTVREVSELRVHRDGRRVFIDITADGYLYNMVRIIAGTLLRVGTGREPIEYPRAVLLSASRAQAGDTLAAKGLFLRRVDYPQEVLGDCLPEQLA